MERYLNTDYSILSRIKRTITKKLPKSIHCYCVGAEKTGTTSIHHMFNKNYRSGHEIDHRQTIQLAVDYLEDDISPEKAATVLYTRDRELNLEIESAHYLAYISDILADTFKKAKFIVTIREPYSQLKSRLNWHYTTNHPSWNLYYDYFLANHHAGFAKEEKLLENYNLYSLDTYLQDYSNHYKYINENIPGDRRLLIKTQNLNSSTPVIASFLNVSEKSILIQHSNKRGKKIPILSNLDQAFVRNKIWEHCSEMIRQFFPETLHLYDK